MEDIDLNKIRDKIRNYVGITRKQPIREVYQKLKATHSYGDPLPNYGDDAAVIPWGDGFLLFATDGMMQGLLLNEPYAAGKAAVMVTVNDIYAMGGKPVGLVNVLASGDDAQRSSIVEGIAKGCRKLRVPMLGGHLHPDAPADNPSLSVAILGFAKKLIRSHLAETGDHLILAVDLNGRRGCRSVVSWDANSGKTPDELLDRLETLPAIAEKGLAVAGKDVSNGGIIGTAAIMVENSARGAIIDVAEIPRPENIDFEDWLLCFQSFGFILAAPPENTEDIVSLFENRHITAKVIGTIVADRTLILKNGSAQETLYDFTHEYITGIHRDIE